jgi:hypothetical protein
MYIDIKTYFTATLRGKINERRAEERQGGGHEVTGVATISNSVARTGTGGQRCLQALQD